jgi:putative flippase GtrA
VVEAPLLRQFVNFVIVGIPATIVHYAVLIALVETWRVNPVLATTAGFTAATVLSYVLNRRYTFDAQLVFGHGLVKYYAIMSVGVVLNGLIVDGLIRLGAMYLLAQIIATCLVLSWNFVAARFFVFRGGAKFHSSA